MGGGASYLSRNSRVSPGREFIPFRKRPETVRRTIRRRRHRGLVLVFRVISRRSDVVYTRLQCSIPLLKTLPLSPFLLTQALKGENLSDRSNQADNIFFYFSLGVCARENPDTPDKESGCVRDPYSHHGPFPPPVANSVRSTFRRVRFSITSSN